MNNEELIKQISEKISIVKPYKVILFGSFAYGKPDLDSDIDIIVVLNKRGFPVDYNEKMGNHRKLRRLLRDINKIVSLDIIVFTIDEWDAFVQNKSSFSRIVLEKGKAIA